MDKLKMHTKSKVDVNIESIGALFPNTVTETIKGYDENDNPIVEKAIDFDILKQELSKVIVEGREERYQMNWPGKKEAILAANTPVNKTLRPCRADSVKFDETENLYIEGDNLEVLKLLRETYLNRVKMIYIDPPYNTGNDSFVYNDNFAKTSEEFSEVSGQYDEDGNINYDIRKNNESNGKFHTDWLNMMYPRLKLAKDLLKDDGYIFISIDSNENDNLKKICNEIFGESNYYGEFIWQRRSGSMDSVDNISIDHEYVMCYGKLKHRLRGIKRTFNKYTNPDNDPRGPWIADNLTAGKPGGDVYYPIINPENGDIFYPPKGRYWPYNRKTMECKIKEGRILFPEKSTGRPMLKRFMNEAKNLYVPVSTIMRNYTDKDLPNNSMVYALNTKGTSEIQDLFTEKLFQYPKSTILVKSFLEQGSERDSIIIDFFSGSATTAHAVMKLNAEDGGNRKFIMVQLPEVTDEKSEARKAGYENICEIGKERIRRAGKKIIEENPEVADKLDIGFRVLKLDSSNMKDVYYNPNEYTQDMLSHLESNIKDDRTSEDLLFQVMLDLGELLSSDIKEINIEGKKVFNVGDGNIVACFDEEITNEVLTEIAKMQPLYAVFRDSSLSNDSVATNFEQIFKTYSPNTIRKVL